MIDRQRAAFRVARRIYRFRDLVQKVGYRFVCYGRSGEIGDLVLPPRCVERSFPNRSMPRARALDLVHRP